jgi:hypothetical protein
MRREPFAAGTRAPLAHPIVRLSGESLVGIRTGVPFPRGSLFGSPNLRAHGLDGEPLGLAVQSRVTGLWPDGSVKWLLVDIAPGKVGPKILESIELRPDGANQTAEMRVVSGPDFVEVDSQVARFRFVAGGADLLRSVSSSKGKAWLDGGLILRCDAADVKDFTVTSVRTVETGPVRTVVAVEGRFGEGSPLELLGRWSVYAGSPMASLDLRLRNARPARHSGGIWDLGDPGSVLIRELSLVARPGFRVDRLISQVAPGADQVQEPARPWSVFQDSSGGEFWDSPNHVEADGSLGVAFRGYRMEGGSPPTDGDASWRAQPAIAVSGGSQSLGCVVRDFWQNFPKALGWGAGEIRVGLFPRERGRPIELQGGEQKRHSISWMFGDAMEVDLGRLQEAAAPSEPSIDPHWVQSTGAVRGLIVDLSGESSWTDYVTTIVDGPRSFLDRREAIDEYGWRNFGDLWADHEAVNHTGPEPFVSHYNNQYDFVWAAGLHAMRTGDPRWARLARECAEHTIDIDIYHTTGDRRAYNGGLFWHTDHYVPARTCTHRTYSRNNGPIGRYGGGPANEHNYASGLLLHYWRTGDPDALEAVGSLADWVLAMDDASVTLAGLIDGGPSGLASKTVHAWYHGPGRGAGNSIATLLDGYLAFNRRAYLDKAEELVRRCVHPQDDIAALGLDDVENRWSYLVFLQALGRYAELKLEYGELDYMFHYARESLLHYAEWMLEHEVPYKDVLHRVELPTESWPAHDIRKCHVFHLAARFDDRGLSDRFTEQAAYFHDRCLADLGTFSTRHLTRPLVLLAGYAHLHAYHRAVEPIDEAVRRGWRHIHDFGTPLRFVEPRQRATAVLGARWVALRREIVRLVRDRLGSRLPGRGAARTAR